MRALRAHRAHELDRALHVQGERVAADAAAGAGALGQLRRRAVRAAAAEVRLARQHAQRLAGLAPRAQARDGGRELARAEQLDQMRREVEREALGSDLGMARQPRCVARVALAEHARPVDLVAERGAQLLLEKAAPLVDDDDLVEALCELVQPARLERVQKLNAQQPDAVALELRIVQPEQLERGEQLAVQATARDQADAVAAMLPLDRVEAVHVGIAAHGLEALVEELLLDALHGRRQEPRIEALLERAPLELELGQLQRTLVRQLEDHAAVRHVGHDLERHPGARVAREREGVLAELDDLAGVRRVEHRHLRVCERHLAVARQRRALAGRVVAHQSHGAAEARDSLIVRVPDRIQRAIQPGRLAEPQAHHPVEARVGKQIEHLRARDGARGELLVQPRDEAHVLGLEQRLQAGQELIEAGERGARISRVERADTVARGAVAAHLIQTDAHQRLEARQVNAPLRAQIAVPQRRDRGHFRHRSSDRRAERAP